MVYRFFTKEKDALDIGAAMSLLIVAALSQISFPLQNPATITVVVFCAAALMQGERPRLTINLPLLTSRVFGVLFLAIGIGVVVSASTSFKAEKVFIQTKANITVAHPAALQANLRAYEIYPYERRYRHQLMLTVGALLKSAHGDVTITKEAADQAYRIANTASRFMPAVQMTRLEYLLNGDRWKEERDEIDELLSWLKSHAKLQPGVWLAEGYYAAKTGDALRLINAINAGLSLPTETHDEALKRLAEFVKTEPISETPS